MKRVLRAGFFCLIAFHMLQAKLHIRHNYFGHRVARMPYDRHTTDCCADQRRPPMSASQAEREVNHLRMQAINAYDSGAYMAGMAGWSKYRRRALDIQTKLGYTVPERYTWGW